MLTSNELIGLKKSTNQRFKIPLQLIKAPKDSRLHQAFVLYWNSENKATVSFRHHCLQQKTATERQVFCALLIMYQSQTILIIITTYCIASVLEINKIDHTINFCGCCRGCCHFWCCSGDWWVLRSRFFLWKLKNFVSNFWTHHLINNTEGNCFNSYGNFHLEHLLL